MAETDDDHMAMKTTTVYPVVLFDGEREMNAGNLKIHPDLTFKEFQIKLSQLLGISYNNLTTYLVDNKNSKFSTDRRKILITGKANFAVIVREINCYFLVVLKRSRRDRRRKPGTAMIPPDDLSRVHRSYYDCNYNYNYNDYNNDTYSSYYYDNQDLRMMQRDHYMDMILSNSNSAYGFDPVSPLNMTMNFPAIDEVYLSRKVNQNRSLCKECTVTEKQGKKAEFHHCVYDEVVVGFFRSPAGPIGRPS